MKLAEALQERADLNKRIEQLHSRLNANAIVQEDVPAAEDPTSLMEELERCLMRLQSLQVSINRTNVATQTAQGNLMALLCQRDRMAKQLAILRDVTSSASNIAQRVSRTEIVLRSAIDVQEMHARLDSLSHEYRLLDNCIQAANWATELAE